MPASMHLTGRQRVLALMLASMGGAAWWWQSTQVAETPVPITRERLPDYRAENLAAITMDETGRPTRRLSAERLRHYADDDSSEFDRPTLVVYRPDGQPWHIHSETGWASGDGERVWLHGQVHADRQGDGEVKPVHLTTSELLIRPRQEYAETTMPVEIVSLDDRLNSTGMQVWFGETAMRARFLGRARARMAVQ